MAEKKRHDLPTHGPGALWVVATPIGNLEELSPRARSVLERSDLILCEDTRRTSKLLSAASIGGLSRLKRLEYQDPRALRLMIEKTLEALAEGKTVALVSDAGTPAISDPGAELVAAARSAGFAVSPVSGPTAVGALLSVSGFAESAFTFRGFLPRKGSERKKEISTAMADPMSRVFVWYESPQRISASLRDLAVEAPGARVVVGKEITKMHEKFFSGSGAEVSSAVDAEIAREGTLGEWAVAVLFCGGPGTAVSEEAGHEEKNVESSDWVKALRCLIDARVSASEAAKRVSQHFGARRNVVYEMALKISSKKVTEGG